MKLSLEFIARRLDSQFGCSLAGGEASGRFDSARLFDPEKPMKKETLYVCAHPVDGIPFVEGAGLVALGPSEPHSSMPVIWVESAADPLAVLDALLDVLDFYAEWGESVEQMFLGHVPSKQIAARLQEVIRNPVVYLNESLHVLYISDCDFLDKFSQTWGQLKREGTFHPISSPN